MTQGPDTSTIFERRTLSEDVVVCGSNDRHRVAGCGPLARSVAWQTN